MSLNWNSDDGINLPMINDFLRNQFYDKTIGKVAAGQYCTDIGFGNGMLSMIALKHGANYIIAYEKDEERYQLGCELIERLNLKDKIDLRNENFEIGLCETPIVFHEIIGATYWNEHLYYSLVEEKDKDKIIMIPGENFAEIWAMEVPESFAAGLIHCHESYDYHCQEYFAPGIDIDQFFVNFIAEKSNTKTKISKIADGLHTFKFEKPTVWGWRTSLHAIINTGKPIGGYCYSTKPENPIAKIEINVDQWKNSTVLLVPRYGCRSFGETMYIDQGHWSSSRHPIILKNPKHNINFFQDLRNGKYLWKK